jgi:hypothetical protein
MKIQKLAWIPGVLQIFKVGVNGREIDHDAGSKQGDRRQ